MYTCHDHLFLCIYMEITSFRIAHLQSNNTYPCTGKQISSVHVAADITSFRFSRVAVSHADCDYSREQVKISLPSVVKQPLHVALGEQGEGEKREGEGKILMKGSKSQRHRQHVHVHVHVDRH